MADLANARSYHGRWFIPVGNDKSSSNLRFARPSSTERVLSSPSPAVRRRNLICGVNGLSQRPEWGIRDGEGGAPSTAWAGWFGWWGLEAQALPVVPKSRLYTCSLRNSDVRPRCNESSRKANNQSGKVSRFRKSVRNATTELRREYQADGQNKHVRSGGPRGGGGRLSRAHDRRLFNVLLSPPTRRG